MAAVRRWQLRPSPQENDERLDRLVGRLRRQFPEFNLSEIVAVIRGEIAEPKPVHLRLVPSIDMSEPTSDQAEHLNRARQQERDERDQAAAADAAQAERLAEALEPEHDES